MPKRRIPIRISQPRRSKFNAVRTTVDGITFGSKKEAERYQHLKWCESHCWIDNLVADKKQLRYPLVVNGVKIGVYEADFRYWDSDRGIVVEDVKGFKTPAYKIKKKLVKALHGIEIREL